MKKKKHKRFVILASPDQRGRQATTWYIAKNGSKRTDLKIQAARFVSRDEAVEFAEKMKIKLSALTYIDQEEFTDLELSQY